MRLKIDEHEDEHEQQEGNMTLFTPLKCGTFKLSHRIVMGPMTRCRSYGSIPQPHVALYYSQRATQGGLIITEATAISPTADGYLSAPGIWTQEQVEAWRPIVKTVHRKGGVFICQLSHVGRRSHTSFQPNGGQPISSTSKPIQGSKLKAADGSFQPYSTPRALKTEEIHEVIEDYVSAAKNAISAGFDGVELHGANGYLLDQFMKDGVNDRTDQYGGPIPNRARFVLEVVEAVANAIGKDRVGIKLSPYADSWDAGDSDPTALGVYMAERLSDMGILYVALQEARVQNDGLDESRMESVWPFRSAFKGLFFVGGGYTRQEGMEAIKSGKADAVVYAHLFLGNPDLPRRFALSTDLLLNEPNFDTLFSSHPVVGYTDYPFLDEDDLQFDPNNEKTKIKAVQLQ
ncbi:unnamed protein product [Calypogeia fissa]